MENGQEQKNPQHPASKKGDFGETVRFVIISLVVVFVVRHYIAQPFIVSGESMVPTFEDGEYLVVDQLSYRFNEPLRNDVIIMRYPLEPQKFFIKRIIGLPGETLDLTGDVITITPADGGESFVLQEPLIKSERREYLTITLEEGEYYVLGDNRDASLDSRRWGPLPAKNIIGKPILRLFPFSRIEWKPGLFGQSIN